MTTFSTLADAQTPLLPNPSVTQSISQSLGLATVTVSYSRPHMKNRRIFGSLVPYGTIWRTGANSSTKLTFTEEVNLEGNVIPAGSYSLFTIPGECEWIIIISKDVGHWGAYSYNEKNDFVRFTTIPLCCLYAQEALTFIFTNSTTNSTELHLIWDRLGIRLSLSVDHDARTIALIEELMKDEHPNNLVYFNAIQYYYNNNKDLFTALNWIKRAKNDIPENPAYHLFESRFLLRKGDNVGAIAAAEAGVRLAKKLHFHEYIKLNMEAVNLATSQ
ncbi:MAG: DUF2911 domain-containing protein [Mucilaginibacter sp.]|nr:DUF2911 domain-containing protein [Mucilaginibacter sp.]